MRYGPRIRDYYEDGFSKAKAQVSGANERDVLGSDPDAWARELFEAFALEPIQIDSSRQECLDEVADGSLHFILPVVPSRTLLTIMQKQLTASVVWADNRISSMRYDDTLGTLSMRASPDKHMVEMAIRELSEQVKAWNDDIAQENGDHSPPGSWTWQIKRVITARQENIRTKNKHLESISDGLGITLRRRTEIDAIVPIALPKRKEIQCLTTPTTRDTRRPLTSDSAAAILDVVEKQCRQFERTPTVFGRLREEDLRDVILSSLNAIFDGGAVGEAFQGLGKIDIHLRLSPDELFVAECKHWKGPKSLEEAVAQLLDRLTWRESYGVVLLFSRNAGFSEALATVKKWLEPKADQGLVTNTAPHRFGVWLPRPTDPAIKIHVELLAHDLAVARPSGRSTPAKRDQLASRRSASGQ